MILKCTVPGFKVNPGLFLTAGAFTQPVLSIKQRAVS